MLEALSGVGCWPPLDIHIYFMRWTYCGGYTLCLFIKVQYVCVVLARWLSCLERHPVHQKIAGSILGQSTSLGSLVRFPVRAHAWFAGQVPSRGHVRGNHTSMFLSLFLPPFPSV